MTRFRRGIPVIPLVSVTILLLIVALGLAAGAELDALSPLGQPRSSVAVGKAPVTVDPGILTYTDVNATKDWVKDNGNEDPEDDFYYYLENEYAKYIIGATSYPQTSDYTVTGIGKQGALVEGTLVDAVSKGTRHENLDYSEFVLVNSTHADLRNWFYWQHKLRMPEITADVADKNVTAEGQWDYNGDIKSEVVYTMEDGSPLLRMDVTLTNTGGSAFSGRLGYIIDYNEGTANDPDRVTYIPGVGWKNTDAAAGTQLTSGWTEGYVFIGQMGKYTGKTAHAVIWDEENQPACAIIPKFAYTGAWFDVTLPADGGSQTVTVYHLAEVPANLAEPYATASQWAAAVANGDPLRAVEGTVKNAAGQPIQNAAVTITGPGGGYTLQTSDTGYYRGWVPEAPGCTIAAAAEGMPTRQQALTFAQSGPTVADFAMTTVVSAYRTSSQDPGFTAYESESSTKDWTEGSGYYLLENALTRLTVGTVRKFIYGTTETTPAATGNNALGSMVPGMIMDAAPMAKLTETLDWTEFVLRGGKVQKSWWYPKMHLNLPNITANLDGSITASGTWDNNANVPATVRYSLVEDTPLVKMEITLQNNTGGQVLANLGYLIDSETPGEQDTYVPGSLGWRTTDWTNPDYPSAGVETATQTPTSGWNDNFIFMGRRTGYSGKPAHAILWSPQNTVYSVIPKNDYTGVWIPASMAAGAAKSITLYYLPHIPGASDEPWSVAKLWADALESGTMDQYKAVTGHLTDIYTGGAVSGATVTFTGGGQSYKGMTDENGLFQIYVKKDVSYTATAFSASIETLTVENVTVTGHRSLELSARPRENPPAVELPDDGSATAELPLEKPEFTYAAEGCDSYSPGDLLLQSGEARALIGASTGGIHALAPASTGRDALAGAELLLSDTALLTAGSTGKGFAMTSAEARDGAVILNGTSQTDGNVSATVRYSAVENSPLLKIKVTLKNNGTAAYRGFLGYLLDPKGNGEQTYLPGTGWIGGGPGAYGAALKRPGAESFLFSGSLGRENENPAYALLWSSYFVPDQLVWGGDVTGAWYDLSIAAGGEREIIFYQLVHPAGAKDSPLDTARFWSRAVSEGIDPGAVTRIEGTVSLAGEPSENIVVTASASGNTVTAATLPDGRYRLYVMAGTTYSVAASNGREATPPQTVTPGPAGAAAGFELGARVTKAKAGFTYGDPDYVYNPGAGLRDWWPTYPYYYLENDFTAVSIYNRRVSKLTPDRPSQNPSVWAGANSGNGVWGAVNAGTIADAVSKQNRTENLDWSSFVLFPTRPAAGAPSYYDRNYLGVTDADEAIPNEMYMEWSWWFPVNKLELPNITTDGETVTASGAWEGGVAGRSNITAQVKYSLVENSPLIRMDVNLHNSGAQAFSGQFAYVLDPDMEGEQHSYVPGRGWEYAQTKTRITGGWTDNYIFDGFNGFSGNTAHAILWPDNQQPMLVFSEGGWISAWFQTEIAAGGSDTLTVYYLPHTPGGADAPYSVAEYWARFFKNGGDPQQQAAISGIVTDANGNPVPGARVTLWDGDEVLCAATADEGGAYTLFAEAGSYALQAESPGYAVFRRELTLVAGEHSKEEICLIRYANAQVSLPAQISRGDTFGFSVTVENTFGAALEGLRVELIAPDTLEILTGRDTLLQTLPAGGSLTINAEAMSVAGGRRNLTVRLSGQDFSVEVPTAFDVSGPGWYGGDNHSHSTYSDGVSTPAQNAQGAYENWNMSWLWLTEHNNDQQKQAISAINSQYGGAFVALSGTEITTGYKHNPPTPSGEARGHALAYGYEGVPTLVISERGGAFDWQDSIDQVIGAGGLFYIAHPFDPTYSFDDAEEWTGYTGVEVWNGSAHASNPASQAALALWDRVNIRGEKYYYGIAGTDGHSAKKIGDLGIRGLLDSLTSENILNLLSEGKFFGTNGPELRFRVAGGEMGTAVSIPAAGAVTVDYEAYTPHGELTYLRILGYPVTGNAEDYDPAAAVVWEENLAGQGKTWKAGSLSVTVDRPMFFRMEVKSSESVPGATGNGPEVGTGFAFSNPVWLTIGTQDTSRRVDTLTYNGVPLTIRQERFGVRSVRVDGALTASAFTVPGKTAQFSLIPSEAGECRGILDVTVISGGEETRTSYLVYGTP